MIISYYITQRFSAAELILKLPLPRSHSRPLSNFKPNNVFKVLNVKCRIADDRKKISSKTRKIAIAMSVAEMEAGEVDDLIRVPFSGPAGSTFRDYK